MEKLKSSEFSQITEKLRKIIVFTNLFWLLAFGFIAFLFWRERVESKKIPVYVISDNGRFLARQAPEDVTYDFDLRNDVKVFIANFYEYDKNDFTDRIETALNLVDNVSGKSIYASIKSAKIYDALRDKNARTKVEFDSIKTDLSKRPVHVRAYFKQHIFVSDLKMSNPVAAEFDIVPFSRSEKNPFGLLITNFSYIPYNVVMNTVKDPNFISKQDAQQQIEALKQQSSANEKSK